MFRAWPKIPRLENEIYYITEKIDGTNGAIIIQDSAVEDGKILARANSFYIWAQSRTRLITPEDDNFSFAKWVKDNAEQLISDLGVGYHYGEWWGKGINRGYGLEERRFSLFNPTKHSDVCYHVPKIAAVSAEALIETIQDEIEQLKMGSYAAPGYMRPEGLVIYAEKAKTYWKVIIDK
jgi:hypothetical protein